MLVRLTPVSSNRKTGPMPVSVTEKASCPDACPMKGKECYAELGPSNIHWNAMKKAMTWEVFCQAVKALIPGQLWRHNEAGDLPGIGDEIDVLSLAMLVKANKGKRGYTYTHKPVIGESEQSIANRDAVRHANDNGFTVNLSADTLAEADELSELAIGPVVVVLPSDAENGVRYVTPMGKRVVTCPAAMDNAKDGMNCARCKLCAIPARKSIIGFPAHGTRKRMLNERLASGAEIAR